MKKPFLWEFTEKVLLSTTQSGGEERVHTKSLAEENIHAIVKFTK